MSEGGTVELTGRRAVHVRTVLKASRGDHILVGSLGGRMGLAEVLSGGIEDPTGSALVLRPTLDREPPAPSPVSLILALPRPKMLRRVLQAVSAMGVKKTAIVGTFRVEKSYFGSPVLAAKPFRDEFLLGLEQGRDTILPEVSVHRFFKPFLEDELDDLFPGRSRILAHTVGAVPLEAAPPASSPSAVLAIGPEGGFTTYEATRLCEKGFTPVSLGPRALRVDAAVPFAVGQLEFWLSLARRSSRS